MSAISDEFIEDGLKDGYNSDFSVPEDPPYDVLDVGATVDGIRLKPVVLNTETKGTADIVTYTDQCRREEADQTSSGNAQHRIEAILYWEYVTVLYNMYKSGEKIDITLPANLDSVSLFITDMTVNQGQDELLFVNNNGLERPVWSVQVQLKSSGAIEDAA